MNATSEVLPGNENAKPLRLALANLGCKLNHAEGEAMKNLCAGAGFELVPFDTPADVYVVNSCTVTAEADREGRRLARRARRAGGAAARVVIAGCSAQANAERMSIPEVDLLLGNGEKLRLPAELRKPPARGPLPEVRVSPPAERLEGEDVVLPQLGSRTRAYLKVQDGCNFSCTFCATTIARGRSRSLDAASCVRNAEALVAGGHEEVVLTGIHLGAYGRDLQPRGTLSRLVERLLDVAGFSFRLRISSVEPGEFTRELVRVAAGRAYGESSGSYVCRHFHIPVQSGDDEVLGAMGRNYTAERCARRFAEIARRIEGVCLGADFIVGFPGESPRAFERTAEWVREAPLAYLHVFPYSPREGTAAIRMSGEISAGERKSRARTLQELGRRKWAAFVSSQAGKKGEVLFESRYEGLLSGLTDNYVRVLAEGPDAWLGRTIPVRLLPLTEKSRFRGVAARADALWGEALS